MVMPLNFPIVGCELLCNGICAAAFAHNAVHEAISKHTC